MKNRIIKSLAIIMAILCMCPMTAYADEIPPENIDNPIEWEDIELTDEEIEEIFQNNNPSGIQPYATGLINSYNIGIAKSGSKLLLAAKTYGSASVVKSGFTEIVIQKRKNSSESWITYIKYIDLYVDNNSYLLSKSLTVPTGYQYRATCIHYAKKNIFSVQKINDTSNIVTM